MLGKMKRLILADVHANLPALEAILAAETDWEELIFLGDAVIGGPQPEEVVQLLASLPGVFLVGNHDLELLRTGPETSPDGGPHRAWVHWTRRNVSDESLAFLRRMRQEGAIQRDGRRLYLFHGQLSGRGDSRVWPDSPPEVFSELAGRFGERLVLLGHSHVQFRREHDGVMFINPGGAGQPRLGRPLAAYAIMEDGTISLRSTSYDTEAVCRAMATLPLPREFIAQWQRCYRTGILPSRYRLRDFSSLLGCHYV